MYFNIDCIDNLIYNEKMPYRTRKYWPSPMTHVKALAVVVVYAMYILWSEGLLNNLWDIIEPIRFWYFIDNCWFSWWSGHKPGLAGAQEQTIYIYIYIPGHNDGKYKYTRHVYQGIITSNKNIQDMYTTHIHMPLHISMFHHVTTHVVMCHYVPQQLYMKTTYLGR